MQLNFEWGIAYNKLIGKKYVICCKRFKILEEGYAPMKHGHFSRDCRNGIRHLQDTDMCVWE